MTVSKTTTHKEAPVLSEPSQESLVKEAQAKRPKKPVAKIKTTTPLAETTAPNVLIPATPEAGQTNAKSRKRLSKAFPRPLDKKFKKETLVRDRFTFPELEYAQFARLKKRLSEHEMSVKKSELIRAGLMLLSALDDNELKTLLSKVPAVD